MIHRVGSAGPVNFSGIEMKSVGGFASYTFKYSKHRFQERDKPCCVLKIEVLKFGFHNAAV